MADNINKNENNVLIHEMYKACYLNNFEKFKNHYDKLKEIDPNNIRLNDEYLWKLTENADILEYIYINALKDNWKINIGVEKYKYFKECIKNNKYNIINWIFTKSFIDKNRKIDLNDSFYDEQFKRCCQEKNVEMVGFFHKMNHKYGFKIIYNDYDKIEEIIPIIN